MSTLSRSTAFAGSFYRNTSALRRISLLRLLGLRRSRRALKGLSPAQLADIGITAETAAAEARRPMWDVPAHWLS